MKYILYILSGLLLFSCKGEDIIAPENPESEYTKVLTVDSSNYKFELYSAFGSSLLVGYNELGIKVFENNVEKTDGFVRYVPSMFHTGGQAHKTPYKEFFYYNTQKKMYTGYACYIMLSDTTSFWISDYSYNDIFTVKRKFFDVYPNPGSQMRFWLDLNTNFLYLLTLIQPADPKTGLNTYKCILHKSFENSGYSEVDSARMFIRPWMPSHGHGSSSNVNPVWINNGIYEGKTNFTMAGNWYVYDSISVNNQFITPNPPIYFVFDVR